MGCGSFSSSAYAVYNTSLGRSYDHSTGRISGQEFVASHIDASLDPRRFKVRECVNNAEHPNTIPVILALDVTGSMGAACKETAEALGVIITNLYQKIQDVEFCIMGIGDLAYDHSPIQMSQFESDVRIAEAIDKIYIENGGGGNNFESYTAAWYMGLKRTKLDCFDKQGRKGIIITMGDEPMNPYLPQMRLNSAIDAHEQGDIGTMDLYQQASKKFDIFHIAVDSPDNCYIAYAEQIANSFGALLKDRFKVSTIQNLAKTIEDCILEATNGQGIINNQVNPVNEKGEISW